VLPIIRAKTESSARLMLVGAQRCRAIASCVNRGDIEELGVVQDLVDVCNRARVFVAPTRFSSGIPLKVLDAAAHGVPTVMTPLLAAQLGWQDGMETLVSDEPEMFADRCVLLHSSASTWNAVRVAAARRVSSDANPWKFVETLRLAVQKIILGDPAYQSGVDLSSTQGSCDAG
jgi:glycosyltransferase involved in cell wall biosynthesis